MTQQVRTSYRNHRKAAWGLALLLAAAIAAVSHSACQRCAPNQTLKFVTQPPSLLAEQHADDGDCLGRRLHGRPEPGEFEPAPTPSLSATGAGTIANFVVARRTTAATTAPRSTWTWNVTPKSSAPSGVLQVRRDARDDPDARQSNTFRVVQFICPPSGGPSCDGTSNFGTAGQGKLKIANTLGSPILLDFQVGAGATPPVGCNGTSPGTTWNRAYYIDARSATEVYFPRWRWTSAGEPRCCRSRTWSGTRSGF